MAFLIDLWLPILVSAVFVFIASSVIHMVIPMHKSDHAPVPGEEAVLEAMRKAGVGRGTYVFPFCADMKQMGSEEMTAKLARGPVGFMTILPNGPWKMGRSLLQWFVYTIVVSIFAAYVGSFATTADADYLAVFRLTGTVAFMGYGLGAVLDSIWKGAPWSNSLKFVIDGLVYALVTAGAFGWLWPAA